QAHRPTGARRGDRPCGRVPRRRGGELSHRPAHRGRRGQFDPGIQGAGEGILLMVTPPTGRAGSIWQDKTVLITGGAGGLGLAFAQRYRDAGANLALADLDASRLPLAVTSLGGECLTIAADVANVADCARMVEATVARFGRLDLLINAAGIWVEGPAEAMSEAMWDRCLDINLKGTFFACRHAIPALEATGGSILNIASDAGLMGSKGASIYCASKGGVVLLTKALALELAARGVRCNAVCPCDVDTPMIDYQANTFGRGDP